MLTATLSAYPGAVSESATVTRRKEKKVHTVIADKTVLSWLW